MNSLFAVRVNKDYSLYTLLDSICSTKITSVFFSQNDKQWININSDIESIGREYRIAQFDFINFYEK